jgi:hypothetical protein
MITDIHLLRRALKGSKPLFAGVILWQGASLLDGAPVVAIANKIVGKSTNEKTGAMVQTFIIRSDMDPVAALRNGGDASVCGDCKHRPILARASGEAPCYVQVAKSVLSVYGAYTRGRYARAGVDFHVKLLPELFAGLAFRIGTYGDPTAIPFQTWRAATLKAAFVNGYVHQWLNPKFQAFRLLCMASADTDVEMAMAHGMGWRTFRVRDSLAPLQKGVEIMCPASKEAGYKTDCASCKACGGLSAKAKVSIAILPHGIGSPKLQLAA